MNKKSVLTLANRILLLRMPRARYNQIGWIGLCMLAAVCCISESAFAKESSPHHVAEAYMTAMKKTDWPGAAALMHPHSLSVIHQVFVSTYEESPQPSALSRLYGVQDLQAFRDLAPAEFFVRFMTAVLTNDPNFSEAMQHIQFEIQDEQIISENEVKILYSTSIDGPGDQMSESDELTLRRSSKGWKIYSTPDLAPLLRKAEK